MLFGFLLTIPFAARFDKLDTPQRCVFGFAVMSTVIASAFYIAPAVYHRVHDRERVRRPDDLKKVFSILAILGSAFLGLSLVLSIGFVMSFLFPTWVCVV